MITSLRIRKEEIADVRSYACYDFGDYANVPAEWHASRNAIYSYGAVVDWNMMKFTSAYGSKDAFRTSWVRKTLVGKT